MLVLKVWFAKLWGVPEVLSVGPELKTMLLVTPRHYLLSTCTLSRVDGGALQRLNDVVAQLTGCRSTGGDLAVVRLQQCKTMPFFSLNVFFFVLANVIFQNFVVYVNVQ